MYISEWYSLPSVSYKVHHRLLLLPSHTSSISRCVCPVPYSFMTYSLSPFGLMKTSSVFWGVGGFPYAPYLCPTSSSCSRWHHYLLLISYFLIWLTVFFQIRNIPFFSNWGGTSWVPWKYFFVPADLYKWSEIPCIGLVKCLCPWSPTVKVELSVPSTLELTERDTRTPRFDNRLWWRRPVITSLRQLSVEPLAVQ